MSDIALVKRDTIDIVAQKVRQFQESKELQLPANYSPDNAMKSAWLIIQSAVDKNQKPVLEVCTRESIANALLDMVVQGLNPSKKQGYFIPYGDKLVFQRSYFGTMAVAMEVDDSIDEIVAEVVYEGDNFKYKLVRGKKEITEHEQLLENINGKKIKAAYCIIFDHDGNPKKTEIMTFDDIKQAWKQSKMYPVNDNGSIKANSTHDKFTAEMAKKTVVNRACKSIINASNDSYLFKESFSRASEVIAEDNVTQQIAENANSELIDVTSEVVVDKDTGELTEQTNDTLQIAGDIAESALEEMVDETVTTAGQQQINITNGPNF